MAAVTGRADFVEQLADARLLLLAEILHPLAKRGDGTGAAEIFHAHSLDGLLIGCGIELGERCGAELFEGLFH